MASHTRRQYSLETAVFTYVILSHPLHNSVSLPIPSLSCVQFIMIVFISVKVRTLNTDILTVKQLVR
jgi:hypothetical protein